MVVDDGTVSLIDDEATRPPPPGEDLVLVLDAAHPLAPPTCISLTGVDELVLGRGAARAVTAAGPRRLRVDLADSGVSGSHARLARKERGWIVSDEQSKNGTLMNGHRVERAELTSEDLLELGNSFFLIRRGATPPAGGPPAFRTLSAALARQLDLLGRVARSTVPILLHGETGSGKEMLARAAHELSGRGGRFVAVNCGAIPETLMESELFGARKGAYSGADANREGMVAAAHRGTLFLDELAELPEASQAALLRVLQDGEVLPLGTTRPIQVDVRVIAATHQSLAARVAAGRFRDDLYARLRGHVLTLPPLRGRREDLGFLIAEMLRRSAGEAAATIRLQRAAARMLLSHPWPHNIRELAQVIARALAVRDGDEIRLEHLPEGLGEPIPGISQPEPEVARLLRQHGGNVSAVARALATSRAQVRRLVARHGVDLSIYRGAGAPEGDDEAEGGDEGE